MLMLINNINTMMRADQIMPKVLPNWWMSFSKDYDFIFE